MSGLNIGNVNYEFRVTGVEEALKTLNELEEKLKEVKTLISEITSLPVSINYVSDVKQEDET